MDQQPSALASALASAAAGAWTSLMNALRALITRGAASHFLRHRVAADQRTREVANG